MVVTNVTTDTNTTNDMDVTRAMTVTSIFGGLNKSQTPNPKSQISNNIKSQIKIPMAKICFHIYVLSEFFISP